MKPKAALVIFLTVCLPNFGLAQRTNSSDPTWKIDISGQGTIEAPRTETDDGTQYYAFKNIPFAEPPVGELRFKDPVPANSWTGVRNGSKVSPVCPQINMSAFISGDKKIIGSEDCLYLEVYVPKKNSSELPVMVWIHGGGFFMGNGGDYNPTPLMKKDVIVVNIQYRLGIFGFLSTEDAVMPGNYGLKDQVMALQWVKDNIQSFGGDPYRVTIFGQSAGGISVSLLMFPSKARDLFQRAIAQSGTALFPNIIRDDHRMNAVKLAQMLNCSDINSLDSFESKGLYECLKNISSKDIIMNMYDKFSVFSPPVMTPRVDGDFLTEHPARLLEKGNYNNVNFMTGFNRDEGASMVRYLLSQRSEVEELARNFSALGPKLLMIVNGTKSSAEYIAKRMFAHYLGEFNITEENAEEAVKMITDFWFGVPNDVTAQMMAKDIHYGYKNYLYELTHVGENSEFDTPNITFGKNWVSHSDDTQYLFDLPQKKPLSNPINIFMSDLMVTLWTNFARTGNPTPDMDLGFKWDPLESTDLRYLVLQPSPYMRNYTRDDEMGFITNLPTKENEMLFGDRFVREEM